MDLGSSLLPAPPPAMVKLAPGMMVTQNVRLAAPIGEGAMGSVWLAHHVGLNTRVAVKFIGEELARDQPEMVVRFRAEAAASAQIKSPYVVQTFDHGVTDDGLPYIVMEYLEGEGLGARLDRVERLSLPQTAQVLVQVGKALDRAHRHGIIHRDIKPDNIFLSTAEEGMLCKVLDFGIAKHTKLADQKGVTLPGTTVGTPEYMSREQVMTARDVDKFADLWALAIVAYQCVTGELPFVGETLGMVCVAICKGVYTPPSKITPDLPPGVDEWFAKALHCEPSERFQSGRDMALAFVRLLPKTDEPELEPLMSTGQFSLPPPSTETAIDASDPFGSGGADLFAELNREEDSVSDPGFGTPPVLGADRSSQRGRRDGTPTFSGSSAELLELGGARSPRARLLARVAVIGGIVAIAATMALWFGFAGPSGAPAAGGPADGGTGGGAVQSGTSETAPTAVASASPSETASADPSHDASTQDVTDDAGPTPRYTPSRRPGGSQPKGKRPRRDLGF